MWRRVKDLEHDSCHVVLVVGISSTYVVYKIGKQFLVSDPFINAIFDQLDQSLSCVRSKLIENREKESVGETSETQNPTKQKQQTTE